jgi:hypothetical protein
MDEEEFDERIMRILPEPLETLSDLELESHFSVCTAACDRMLNELERRGLIDKGSGGLAIPYRIPETRHVETILTRPEA